MVHRRDDISCTLGWVNAERCGLLKAYKALPLMSTRWTFNQDPYADDLLAVDEDERDGQFTCQACGRSTCALNPAT